MLRFCSLKTGRWGLPLFMLALTCAATAILAWEAQSLQKTSASLDLALQHAPSSDALVAAISRLIPHLQDDDSRSISQEEAALRAYSHTQNYLLELQTVRSLVNEQRNRCQDLAGARRRHDSENPIIKAIFGRLELWFDELSEVDLLMDITPLTALDAPAAEAAIVEWSRGLAGMVDSLQSHTEAAERLEQAEAPRHAPAGERTRRSETLRAFRKVVFDMLDYVRDKQLTSRLFDQYQAAQMRVVTAWRFTMTFAICGTLLSIALFLVLDRSFWKPLQTMRSVIEGIANRRYGDAIRPRGAPELRQMFGSLSAICERGRCADDDREKEVEDRSKQRVRSERLAGIGLLATSVAHEINNPLTAIVGAADGLAWRMNEVASKLKPEDAEIVREYLSMIVSESKRCRAITSKLLDFARGREGERALYDITAIVNDVVGMFRHMREYSSRIVDVNRQDPVRAWCNGPEIKQVVLNLVANALQATPDGGRLDIRIASSPDSVDVLFTDTGSGMTPETLEHIFDPFFSTKGPGAGTGLGLSISHAIVEKHQGLLEAQSAGPGQGSTFRLRLPATETPPRPLRPGVRREELGTGWRCRCFCGSGLGLKL